jgi:hypothetical protein
MLIAVGMFFYCAYKDKHSTPVTAGAPEPPEDKTPPPSNHRTKKHGKH